MRVFNFASPSFILSTIVTFLFLSWYTNHRRVIITSQIQRSYCIGVYLLPTDRRVRECGDQRWKNDSASWRAGDLNLNLALVSLFPTFPPRLHCTLLWNWYFSRVSRPPRALLFLPFWNVHHFAGVQWMAVDGSSISILAAVETPVVRVLCDRLIHCLR